MSVPTRAGGDGGLPQRVVSLVAAGVSPSRVSRAVTDLREAGRPYDTADVVAHLEARVARADGGSGAAAALQAAGAEILVAGQPGYPARLVRAWPEQGAPLWLFSRAPQGGLPDAPSCAVVGTRHPSLDGLDTARALGAALARAGVVVVSGMARGIDQAAHRGALEAGGQSVAVLGTGFGVDYPQGDGSLRDEIAAAGGVVTELLPGAPPRGHHFLARNRIISGLVDVVVVVEGRSRSGALSTAQHAAEQGREVLACPGSINAPASRAPLDLIRDGATVLTRLEDAVEAAGALALRQEEGRVDTAQEVSETARRVLDLLGSTPASIDRVARAVGCSAAGVLAAAAELSALGLASRTSKGLVRVQRP